MTWHNPTANPPPMLHDILLGVRGEDRAAEGCLTPGGYMFSTGHPIDSSRVYAWTELPVPPTPGDLSALNPQLSTAPSAPKP